MNKLDLNAIRRNSVFASEENTDEREKEEDDRDQLENNFIFIFKLLDRTNHGRLRMPEMSCLGEAMIGHPPEEKDIKKQVHHARSRLAANRIVQECIQFCNQALCTPICSPRLSS